MIYRLPAPRRLPYREIALVGGFAVASLFLIAVFGAGYGLYITAAAALSLVGLLAVRWPTATAVTFIAFTPVNRFVIMIVYHYSHSLLVTKSVELWKEAILGAILVRVTYDVFFTPDRKHKILPMDLLALLFVAIGVVYLVYAGPLNQDFIARVQGLRADTVFMLAYFAGRGLHLNRRRLRWIVAGIIPGAVIVAIVAAFQFIEPNLANKLFEYLGYSDFVAFQGQIGDSIAVRNRDLPGADSLPRAGSLLLGDLALAFFQILTVSLAAAMFYCASRLRSIILNGLFLGLMLAALVMTLSRSAMASGAAAIALAAVPARALGRTALFGVIALLLVAGIILSGYIKITAVEALINLGDASAVKHVVALQNSLSLIGQYPLGRGLGTAGNIGQQEQGGQAITNESWYLQIGTEMGVLGMVVYLALVAVVMIIAVRQFLKVHDYWLRTITLTVATTALAMLVLGQFLHAWENTPLSMVFWLFAGIAVHAKDLQEAPDFNEQ